MDILSLTMFALVSFVSGLVFIATSVGILEINFAIPAFEKYFITSQVMNDATARMLLFLIGALIILCALRQLQKVISGSHRDQCIVFNAPHGPIRITLFAIEDMIKKMLDTKNELSHIRPRVSVTAEEIEIDIRANIAADVNIIEVTKEMQLKIHDKLNQLIGDQHNAKIKVEIRKMFLGSKKNQTEEEPEVPFRNYVE